jgi:hypothetical protein
MCLQRHLDKSLVRFVLELVALCLQQLDHRRKQLDLTALAVQALASDDFERRIALAAQRRCRLQLAFDDLDRLCNV